jgi:hypothetical protein
MESLKTPFSTDSIVNTVVQRFIQRSEFGQKKYGVTLDRTDLKTADWIQHMQEELMDAILYLEKLKTTIATTEELLTEQKDVIKEAATKE